MQTTLGIVAGDVPCLLSAPGDCVDTGASDLNGAVSDAVSESFNSGVKLHISRRTDQTLPGSEGTPCTPAPELRKRFIAMFGPYAKLQDLKKRESANVKIEYVDNVQRLQEEQNKLLASLPRENEELWFFHLLLADKLNRPIMNGKVVSENEIYGNLYSNRLGKVYMFQFVLRLPCELPACEEPTHWIEYNEKTSDRQTRHSSACGGWCIYHYDVAKAEDWPTLLNALDCVVCRASIETEFTDYHAAEVLNQYDCLTLRQRSGGPDGRITDQPECPDLTVHLREQQQDSPLGTIIDNQPIQPTESCDQLQKLGEVIEVLPLNNQSAQPHVTSSTAPSIPEHFQSLQHHICTKRAAIGIVIQQYDCSVDEKRFESRLGSSSRDTKIINNISRLLQCRKDDIHLKFDAGHVTVQHIKEFIVSFIAMYNSKETFLEAIFLFVSAHGDQNGVITSCGESVPLKDLLQPLQQIANHVLLLYQPCRGSLQHSFGAPKVPDISGLSFPGQDMAGCCLPEDGLQNVSAIFGSMPGYASYRYSTAEGLLFSALLAALQQPGMAGSRISQKKLAHLTQKQIQKTYPKGVSDSEVDKCGIPLQRQVQVHYAVREAYTITIDASSAECTNPEERHLL